MRTCFPPCEPERMDRPNIQTHQHDNTITHEHANTLTRRQQQQQQHMLLTHLWCSTCAVRSRALFLCANTRAPADSLPSTTSACLLPAHRAARPHSRRRFVQAGAWFGSSSCLRGQRHISPAMCKVDGAPPSSSRRRFSAAHSADSSATQHPTLVQTGTPPWSTSLFPHGIHVANFPPPRHASRQNLPLYDVL